MIKPDALTDEDREVVIRELIANIMSQLKEDAVRTIVYDVFYEDLVYQEWSDLWDLAEVYAPHLLDRYQT